MKIVAFYICLFLIVLSHTKPIRKEDVPKGTEKKETSVAKPAKENLKSVDHKENVEGVVDSVTNDASFNPNEPVTNVWYSNSETVGHGRLIVETKQGNKQNRYDFSYGQNGGMDLSEVGNLSIKRYDNPAPTSGTFKGKVFTVTPGKVTGNWSISKLISQAKTYFKNEGWIKYNYWNQNCYMFADKLFKDLTGTPSNQYKDYFVHNLKGNPGKWFDIAKLTATYGPVPKSISS